MIGSGGRPFGAPRLAVEILSRDTPEHWTLDEKVARHREVGSRS